MKYLLDTNIIIYWWKGNKNIENKIIEVGLGNLALPYFVISELYFGAYKSIKVNENLEKINELIDYIPIINSNNSIMKTVGQIKAELQSKGNNLDDADIHIAAVALDLDIILVSNNIKHFMKIEYLKLENWVK